MSIFRVRPKTTKTSFFSLRAVKQLTISFFYLGAAGVLREFYEKMLSQEQNP